MIRMKIWCKTHPKYPGKQKPKNDCGGCWSLFEAVNDLLVELQEDKQQLEAVGVGWEVHYE